MELASKRLSTIGATLALAVGSPAPAVGESFPVDQNVAQAERCAAYLGEESVKMSVLPPTCEPFKATFNHNQGSNAYTVPKREDFLADHIPNLKYAEGKVANKDETLINIFVGAGCIAMLVCAVMAVRISNQMIEIIERTRQEEAEAAAQEEPGK